MKIPRSVLKLLLLAAAASDVTAFSPSSMSSFNEGITQATGTPRLFAEAAPSPLSLAPSASTSLVTAADSSEKSLTLYEYVLSGGSSGVETDAVSRIANAQDKFQLMRDNLDALLKDMNFPDSGSLGDMTKGFSGGLDGGVDVGSLQNLISSIISGLAFEQNFAWYAAGGALLFALGQRGAGQADAKSKLEAELTHARKKADEAAGAAALAAKGATMAKQAATQVEAKATSDGAATNALLENSRLRQLAVETVSSLKPPPKTDHPRTFLFDKSINITCIPAPIDVSRLSLHASQEMVNQELKKLKAENERLKAQLSNVQGDQKTVNIVGEEKAPSPLSSQEVQDRDPEENEKFLEIIKEVEEANMKGRKKVAQKKKAPKKVGMAKKASKTSTKKASVPKAPTKKASPPKVSAKEAPAPKKKKSPASKSDASRTKDWSQLSDSTLKRKTIAQLKEYLLDQKSTDSSDITKMKKGDLIALVKTKG